MPKKKKSREQKMLADKKRTSVSESLYTFTSTPSKSQAKQNITVRQQTAAITTSSYTYLAKDLRKTLLLTLFILVAELLIYYFL